MTSILEFEEKKLADEEFGLTIDVSFDSNNGVFRRYHQFY
jgi:hypothetical protein